MSFWRALGIFSGLSVIMPLITDIGLPAIPDIARYYNVGTDRIQQTISFLFFGAAIGQIIYGPLTDRFGRKPVIVITMLIFTIISFAKGLLLMKLSCSKYNQQVKFRKFLFLI